MSQLGPATPPGVTQMSQLGVPGPSCDICATPGVTQMSQVVTPGVTPGGVPHQV